MKKWSKRKGVGAMKWWIAGLIILACVGIALYVIFGNKNSTSQSVSEIVKRSNITKKDAEEVAEIIQVLEEIYRA